MLFGSGLVITHLGVCYLESGLVITHLYCLAYEAQGLSFLHPFLLADRVFD
jgi:hypothetical protein